MNQLTVTGKQRFLVQMLRGCAVQSNKADVRSVFAGKKPFMVTKRLKFRAQHFFYGIASAIRFHLRNTGIIRQSNPRSSRNTKAHFNFKVPREGGGKDSSMNEVVSLGN